MRRFEFVRLCSERFERFVTLRRSLHFESTSEDAAVAAVLVTATAALRVLVATLVDSVVVLASLSPVSDEAETPSQTAGPGMATFAALKELLRTYMSSDQ